MSVLDAKRDFEDFDDRNSSPQDRWWRIEMTKHSSANSKPNAPTYEQLPDRAPRAVRGGPVRSRIRMQLAVVTPIFGGSYRTRELDDVDVIRASSIRGHLRFWWRALYASESETAEQLYARESELWGRATTDTGGRSTVEIRVDVESTGAVDDGDINLNFTPGAYALWPARGEKSNSPNAKAAAPRRKAGTKFQLTLDVPTTAETQVKNALRAWILFGGYGGRTRRGLGTVAAIGNGTGHWLPTAPTRAALQQLFGFDILAPQQDRSSALGDVARLANAELHVGTPSRDVEKSWTVALSWLRDFRQGTSDGPGKRAREPGKQPQLTRPSISNWPEADKIRHIEKKTSSHPPRHNASIVWPRAGFGLPIVGQFQTRNRDSNLPAYEEPGAFKLVWRAGTVGQEHDRLASPLIVKALPLADGSFVPCALWLNRAYPKDGEVILSNSPRSGAPFDRLVAEEDTARFSALVDKPSLRRAFLDWLDASPDTKKVT